MDDRPIYILFLVSLLSLFISGLETVVAVETEQEAQRPNIVWINAEDMSPHLGCYGHPDAITPNIDSLAQFGIVYQNAFATAPICSPARSCLATGLYATSLGTQHLRCDVEIPDQVVPLANRLRRLGYFCTNTGKSDYNFSPEGIWDQWNNAEFPWRGRRDGQPFFSFITIGDTHEGRINFEDRYEESVSDLPRELRHDPTLVTIPPFYPDTLEIRRLFARMHDLAMIFDRKVGRVVKALEDDGEIENTVIFVFGDHGNGLPRFKRWLNDSGLRVPLIVFVPPKFRELSPVDSGTKTDRLVSFVDFPATALSLAGAEVPEILQGEPFLGTEISKPRQYVYGARSRADDMFELSRSVFDGRFLYVKHFYPHLPYIQPSVIFDDRKDSFRELRRLNAAGELDEHALKLWSPHKPMEELYDLSTDPDELTNLAMVEEYAEKKEALATELRKWIVEHRDSGFLNEAEYQIRAHDEGRTPFEVVQDQSGFDLLASLDMAWQVGRANVNADDLEKGLAHDESGVRYWAVVTIQASMQMYGNGRSETSINELLDLLVYALDDPSPSVRVVASQTILEIVHDELKASEDDSEPRPSSSMETRIKQRDAAIQRLGELLEDDRPWVALEAARATALLGQRAVKLVPVMKRVVNRNRSEPGSRRPYKDFNYPSFIGWALETALNECGEGEFVKSIAN